MIVIAGLLMLATVVIIGEWITASDSAAANRRALAVSEPSRLVSEQSGFARSAQALDYLRSAEGGTRTISEFYGLRAYLGAPPSVPHPIDDAKSLGGKACLVCHGDGGYVPKWQSYTPVTPHPQLLNCRQCHNPRNGSGLFTASEFEGAPRPELGASALPGSPMPMPHGLQLRENCLACHAGPGAVRELRTSHPERVNCRQCHVAPSDEQIWTRPSVPSAQEGR